MSAIVYSPRFLKHRRFLIILPLLVIPFMVVLFLILGGGAGIRESGVTRLEAGLNVKVPDAHFKKGSDKSKLTLYDEAGRDSLRLKEKIKNDPYYPFEPHELPDTPLTHRLMIDANESNIQKKLKQLNAVINQPEAVPLRDEPAGPSATKSEQLAQLGKMMSAATGHTGHNADIDQLNTMLNKIMAIQHPELLQDSLNRLSDRQKPLRYLVSRAQTVTEAETFGAETTASRMVNRFYDLASDQTLERVTDNTVEAVVPETQLLVSGSTIKLRLLNDIRINGHLINKDEFIYGTTTLNNERLKIQFSSLRSGNDILPVSLEAYDLDGLAGIFIPGSINRDVAKQSGDQAINTLGMTSLDPSLGAQAASAGIQAAKSLMSRKVKLMKVTVKAGYKVILKDSK